MNKKSLGGPRALAIIGSIVMLISLVLPYATSSDDTMTAFTIAERWKELQAIANMSLGVSEVILVMLIAIAIFAVLALMFAIAAKGIPALVFSLLATLAHQAARKVHGVIVGANGNRTFLLVGVDVIANRCRLAPGALRIALGD